MVLVARPAEEESPASLVGLLDLFDTVDPEPAVLDPDTDVFERGRATLRTLRRLTADAHVVLAIDDEQWLDAVSARALRYALRRLDDRPVRVFATHRTGELDDFLLLPREHTEDLHLGPLSIAALRQALRPVVTTIGRPSLEAIHHLSGGNPMYALELARVHDRAPQRAPASLSGTLSARLVACPPSIRAIVETAAALGPVSPERLQAACAARFAEVADAVERGLLVLDDAMRVRCSHPLLASVALAGMAPATRRRLHQRLAGVVTDPDERARHLAAACTERDAATAAELEEAARRAGRRGAPSVAAGFSAHSVRLTPLDDGRALARRAVAEILHRAAAGETVRAVAMLDAVMSTLPPGRERVAALMLRTGLDFGHAEEILAQADHDAESDELLRGRLLDLRAYMTYMYRGDVPRARLMATEALAIADRHGDAELQMLAAVNLATTALLAGAPQPPLMERAMELGRHVRGLRLGRWPDVERARHDLWGGHLAAARATFERLQQMTAESGIEFQRPYRLSDLAAVELAAGHLAVAAQLADDGIESATDAGNLPVVMWLRYPDGLAAAHRGDDERAMAAAAAMDTWGLEHDELPRRLMAHHVRGVLALASGDAPAAQVELLAGVGLARRAGQAHPGVVAVLPDALEAAADAGAITLAAELAAELDGQAAALELPWVDAAARRGRGLAATAARDPDAAVHLAAAARALDELGYALDAARAWWWHGRSLHRRRPPSSGRRRTHRRPSTVPVDGRPPVGRPCRRRPRRIAGGATGALTATEARIAELVAAGHRNSDVAAALFVSVATVEATLTRIYRKLGVRSRTELSRRLTERSTSERAGRRGEGP